MLETEQLHVWIIDDGGETYWWVASTMARALVLHLELNYVDAGVKLDDIESIALCGHMPDSKSMKVTDSDEPQTRTAAEWCKEGEGLVATTCF